MICDKIVGLISKFKDSKNSGLSLDKFIIDQLNNELNQDKSSTFKEKMSNRIKNIESYDDIKSLFSRTNRHDWCITNLNTIRKRIKMYRGAEIDSLIKEEAFAKVKTKITNLKDVDDDTHYEVIKKYLLNH
jgi:hypothetical protein